MTTGDKIKKSVIYILLVLLAAACLFPFLLMMVNATRDGVEITHFFTLIPSTHGRPYLVSLICSAEWQTAYWLQFLPHC